MITTCSNTAGIIHAHVRLTDDSQSMMRWWCTAHYWQAESLRGSNRNQRVETVRCSLCGERRRRVWMRSMGQRHPDREYRI